MAYHPGPLYPPNWNNLRFHYFQKHGYICQYCGNYAKGDLHLHHIRPVKLGGGHTPDNLIVLCSECHYLVHKHMIKL